MKVVWKYNISLGYNELELPYGKAVHCDIQNGKYTMWYEVDDDTSSDVIKKKFMLVATGQPFKFNYHHVHTFFEREGLLVWHLYEKIG